MRRGDVRRIEGAEGHSWSQLHPFPVWGAAGRGQAWGHAGPVLRLGPGAGSELPPVCVCVYKTACVFLCELREEGRRHICFWSPQKALLSGPGGAGVPVEHGAGAGGQVSGYTVCVGYHVVRCGLFYHQLFLHFLTLRPLFIFSECLRDLKYPYMLQSLYRFKYICTAEPL